MGTGTRDTTYTRMVKVIPTARLLAVPRLTALDPQAWVPEVNRLCGTGLSIAREDKKQNLLTLG